MTEEIIIAGFGGQGILFLGELLAQVGMKKGLNVSWLPSYGPEMRGGTANCNVILSNDEISSPIVFNADTLFALNKPSFEKFEHNVKKGGLVVFNSSLIDVKPGRDDINYINVPATEIASKLGNIKVANIVMLGFYIMKKNIFNIDDILEQLKLSSKSESIYNINKKALLHSVNV